MYIYIHPEPLIQNACPHNPKEDIKLPHCTSIAASSSQAWLNINTVIKVKGEGQTSGIWVNVVLVLSGSVGSGSPCGSVGTGVKFRSDGDNLFCIVWI